jgi:hypothetical protein
MHWRKYKQGFTTGFMSSLTIGNFVRSLIWYLCTWLIAEMLGIDWNFRLFMLCWASVMVDAFISNVRPAAAA